jgi:hypothetical protein
MTCMPPLRLTIAHLFTTSKQKATAIIFVSFLNRNLVTHDNQSQNHKAKITWKYMMIYPIIGMATQ